MKGKRYPMEAKIRILRAVDSGQAILDVCREQNLSEVSFHRWKRQFGQMEINEARRLKELERENRELKKMLACGAAAAVKCTQGKNASRNSRPRFDSQTGAEGRGREEEVPVLIRIARQSGFGGFDKIIGLASGYVVELELLPR